MTSCKALSIAVRLSLDNCFWSLSLAGPPGNLNTRSRIAYLPVENKDMLLILQFQLVKHVNKCIFYGLIKKEGIIGTQNIGKRGSSFSFIYSFIYLFIFLLMLNFCIFNKNVKTLMSEYIVTVQKRYYNEIQPLPKPGSNQF